MGGWVQGLSRAIHTVVTYLRDMNPKAVPVEEIEKEKKVGRGCLILVWTV